MASMRYLPALSITVGLLLAPATILATTDPGSISVTRMPITSRDGTTLAGMLVSPGEPIAGIVLLPGSGPAERAGFEPLARELAARGIAALAFDKRGCGESEGSWFEASLEDLADDAVAAVGALRQAAGLGERRVGLWGHSQGVWVATVAARAKSVDFLIGVSGGGLSPRETETYQYARSLDHAGVPAAERARALAVVERYFDYLRTGAGREAIARELAGGGSWATALGLERVLVSENYRPYWSWVATFDPRPIASELRIPVLLVLGGEDHLIPLRESVAAWTASLARAGNPDFAIRIFAAANHDIRIGGGPHGGGAWAPGYLDLLGGWVASRGGASAD